MTELTIPPRLMELLPYRISDAIRGVFAEGGSNACEEIRLRAGRLSTLTVSGGKSVSLGITLSREEIDKTVDRLCGGSLYAHGDTIKNGYITLTGGIRVGICGRAATDNGRLIGISEISSVCIRIPHSVKADATVICELLQKFNYSKGVLIYSPPGEGKTTLLRAAVMRLSTIQKDATGLRVAVVDTRGELEFGIGSKNSTADLLSGYPKGLGIEIALRTLNANVIVCDEIGNEDEARAITDASNGGAALLASAHASDVSSLMSKRSIRLLHDNGVFGAYVGLKRKDGGYEYTVTLREEVI